MRIEERKTRDGGTVSITVDITETKRRERELELRALLKRARLPRLGKAIEG